MRRIFLLALSFVIIHSLAAQINSQSYKTAKGAVHLLGNIELSDLEQAPYGEWYSKYYDQYEVDDELISRINAMGSDRIKVKIFLGTWCGDSKREVTRFFKIVDESNMNIENIEMIGLDSREENYKQGINGEEEGMHIHRVPTFIFMEGEKEVGRIVESPAATLEKDICQTFAGLPPKANYAVANFLLNSFEDVGVEETERITNEKIRSIRRKVLGEGELNTLGYVLFSAGKVEQAKVVFTLNKKIFPDSGNAHDSLGEYYLKTGKYDLAIKNYMDAYRLDATNENAVQKIQELVLATTQGTR